ncbi:Kynurenine 3-monooxygenase and related flavoprotein monooxygenases protein [Dioscorea alata]|uniref:Kynurenine 3-monooxygenase and related flavoprotein monooxygenases protein n=1 Tax=Dioscorea alata TaxID=55571 RepID=A0ACB7WP64_DIOAL|nr:Kynurenine 3-monooxygenase and related flavoprotein monooxygenases protein [Dioscorea alata]
METIEDVIIVGAGLCGLATALGLHRKGVKSVVLESSEVLRAAGFAFSTWTNAWKALEALGIAGELRQHHLRLEGLGIYSASAGAITYQIPFKTSEGPEMRCVRRDLLLETLAKELPSGTIRYSSKVVLIEESGNLKVLHLANGSTLRTKVLIGCDGVNSVVAKWLGLKKPSFAGRSATRGFSEYPDGHGFNSEFVQFFGQGFRAGIMPCDEKSMYWYFTWSSSSKDKEMEKDATKMKQFVITKMQEANVSENFIQVIEKSDMGDLVSFPLKFRWPSELLWRNICKGNVTVAGDALHPMTPDLGQGGCAALEDAIVLARCLAQALKENDNEDAKEDECVRLKSGLENYVAERKWRDFDLIFTSYVFGRIQQGDNAFTRFLTEKMLVGIMARTLIKKTYYDCGKL